MAAALTIATREPAFAAAATLALGAAKELWDARGPGSADGVDLAADLCGASLALLCIRTPAPR